MTPRTATPPTSFRHVEIRQRPIREPALLQFVTWTFDDEAARWGNVGLRGRAAAPAGRRLLRLQREQQARLGVLTR